MHSDPITHAKVVTEVVGGRMEQLTVFTLKAML